VGARFSVRPDRPWGPPSLLYNGYRFFHGGKVLQGRDADHSPPSSAGVFLGRVELYLYPPLGHTRACNGVTLPLLGGVGGKRHALAALPPGKTRYPLHRRLGSPQGRSGQVRKISPPTGIRSADHPARSESLYPLGYPGP
jgi:hypothetical protein